MTYDPRRVLSAVFNGDSATLDYTALARVVEWLRTQIDAAAETGKFSGITSIGVAISFVKTEGSRTRDMNQPRLTSTSYEEVSCTKPADSCAWPECECPRKEPRGTFACPICGVETPHHHSIEREKRAECSGCMNPACEDCSPSLEEAIAQWLHDETEHPNSYPDHTWPETERDDGQREGSFVKIVPLHGQAYFRDVARRLVARFAGVGTSAKDGMKPIYVKQWRTIIYVPGGVADEIAAALEAK